MDLQFDGLLFDLDGTLIDSSEAIVRAWQAFAAKYEIDFDEMLPTIQGKPAQESIAALRSAASADDIAQDAKWLERKEASDTGGVIALPGAVELLDTLNQRQVPWAIVTSGTIPVATARIKAANLPFPKVLVTPEQVSKGKPDPEPYILGASHLGLNIKNCIVFEDAPAGIESGHRAGAKTVGILTQCEAEELLALNATVCISSLLELNISFSEHSHTMSIGSKG